MKKSFWRIMAVLAAFLAVSAFGCGKEEEPVNSTETPAETTASAPDETTAPESTTRDPEAIPLISPDAKKRGSIKVLFIGNSYSVNSSHYMYDFLVEAGFDKVEVAVLYYSGCTLEMHCNFFRMDEPAYRLYYNGKGNWTITPDYSEPANYRMDQVLGMTKWDHIIFNTGVRCADMYSTIDPSLEILENHVRQYQPDAHFGWMGSWASQREIETPREVLMERYQGDQMKMYEAIRDTARTLMVNHPEIEYFIPQMTVIQNMRTSKFGDSGTWICRDGGHLSYDYGYYISGLSAAKSVADVDIEASTFVPEEYKDKFTDPALVAGLKAAVQDAFNDPWHVTENPYQ